MSKNHNNNHSPKFCTKDLGYDSDQPIFTVYSHGLKCFYDKPQEYFDGEVIGIETSEKKNLNINDIEFSKNSDFPYDYITTSGNGYGIMIHFHMEYCEF